VPGESVTPVLRSLVWATELDVLPADRVLVRRGSYLVVRSPSNPGFYWGNLLLFDDPPVAGDAERWEQLFSAEFVHDRRVRHRTFAWDRGDGALGDAVEEFVTRGYDLEQNVGLVAPAAGVRSHRRESREVTVRALDPRSAADEELWDALVDLQVADRDEQTSEDDYRAFCRTRLNERRELFALGRGSCYVALDPHAGVPVASCGVVVADGRGRFQDVGTAAAYRRRGICSRLVADAAAHAAEAYGARSFVIVADASYHALGLYESLGFRRRERVCGVYRGPT
jgi:ribosomal protein S18 acetylase RimI-like enzyme